MMTDKTLGVRVPQRLVDELEQVAEREGNGLSAVIRRLLSQALEGDRLPRHGDPQAHSAVSV